MKIKNLKGSDAYKQRGENRKCNTNNKWKQTEVGMSSSVLTVMWTA